MSGQDKLVDGDTFIRRMGQLDITRTVKHCGHSCITCAEAQIRAVGNAVRSQVTAGHLSMSLRQLLENSVVRIGFSRLELAFEPFNARGMLFEPRVVF